MINKFFERVNEEMIVDSYAKALNRTATYYCRRHVCMSSLIIMKKWQATTFQTKVCFDWPTAGSLYLGVLDWLIQHMFIILAWKNKRARFSEST